MGMSGIKGVTAGALVVAWVGCMVVAAAVLLQREMRQAAAPVAVAAAAASGPQAMLPPIRMLQLRAASAHAMAFLQEAMKHPTAGGYYHLLRAIDECALHAEMRGRATGNPAGATSATPPPKGDPQLTMRRQRALDEGRHFCEGLAATARVDLNAAQLAIDGLRLGDPLLQLAQRAAGTADKRLVLVAAMDLADPLFLFAEADKLFTRSADGKLYFDGQWREDDLAPIALQLAACDMGYPCDHTLALLRDLCAFEAQCFDTYTTLVATRRGPTAKATLNAMRHTMWRAFDKKDPSPFLPPAS